MTGYTPGELVGVSAFNLVHHHQGTRAGCRSWPGDGLRRRQTEWRLHLRVVEDQPEVRSVVEKILTRHGYSVVAADNGAGALQAALTYPGRIDLLITDAV